MRLRPAALVALLASAALSANVTAQARIIELGLEDVKLMAIEYSAELRQAEIEARLAADKWRWSVRGFLPTLSLSANGDERVAMGGPDSMTKRFGLSLGQLVWDGGKMAFQRTMSAIQLAMSEKELARKRQAVANQAASLYYALVAGERKLSITRDLVELSRSQETIARKEFELGKITEADLLEIQLNALQSALDLEKSAYELEDQYDDLKALLRIDEGDTVSLSGIVDPEYEGLDTGPDTSRFVAAALAESPELEKASLEIESLLAQLGFSKRAWLPDVTLSADCSVSGERYPLDSLSYGFSLSFSFPDPTFPVSFDLGARGGSLGERSVSESTKAELLKDPSSFLDTRSAELAIGYKQDQLLKAKIDLGKAMERLLRRYENERRVRKLTADKVALAIKKRDVALKKLELGSVTRKDYVLAESELAKARIELFSAWLTLRTTEWEIESALGLASGGLADFIGAR